jgi:S1-C subfamily serine protease
MNQYPLEITFETVRPSIVAFASRFVPRERPDFPEIIGTGFVVDSRGVAVTNRHVVDCPMTNRIAGQSGDIACAKPPETLYPGS